MLIETLMGIPPGGARLDNIEDIRQVRVSLTAAPGGSGDPRSVLPVPEPDLPDPARPRPGGHGRTPLAAAQGVVRLVIAC